jgi:hypothetical protein
VRLELESASGRIRLIVHMRDCVLRVHFFRFELDRMNSISLEL